MKSLLGGSKKSKTTISGSNGGGGSQSYHHQTPVPPGPPSKSSSSSPTGAPQLPPSPTPEPFQYTPLYARFATTAATLETNVGGAGAASGPKSAPLESTANSGFGITARPSVTAGLGTANRSSLVFGDVSRPTSTRVSSRIAGVEPSAPPGTPGQPIKLRGGKASKGNLLNDSKEPIKTQQGAAVAPPKLREKDSTGFAESFGGMGYGAGAGADADAGAGTRATSPAPPPPPSKSPPPHSPVDKTNNVNVGSSRRTGLFNSVQSQRSPSVLTKTGAAIPTSPTSPSSAAPIAVTPGVGAAASGSNPSSSSRARDPSPEKKTRAASPTKPSSPTKTRPESPLKTRSDSPVKTRSDSPVKTRSDSPVKTRSSSPSKTRTDKPRSSSPTKTRSPSPTKPSSPKYDGMPNDYDPHSPSTHYHSGFQKQNGYHASGKSPTSLNPPPRSASLMTPRTHSTSASSVASPSSSVTPSRAASSRTMTTDTSLDPTMNVQAPSKSSSKSHPPPSGVTLVDKQPSRTSSVIRLLPVIPPERSSVSMDRERPAVVESPPSSSSHGHGSSSQNHAGHGSSSHLSASPAGASGLSNGASAGSHGASPSGSYGASAGSHAEDSPEVEYAPPRRVSQKPKGGGRVGVRSPTPQQQPQPQQQQEMTRASSAEIRPLPVPGVNSARSSGEDPQSRSSVEDQQPRTESDRLTAPQHSQPQRTNSASRPERSSSMRNAVGRTGSVKGPRPKPMPTSTTDSSFYGGGGNVNGRGSSLMVPPTLSMMEVGSDGVDRAEVASPGPLSTSPGSLAAGPPNPPLRSSTSSGSLRPLPEPPLKGTGSAGSSANGHENGGPPLQQQRSSTMPLQPTVATPPAAPLVKVPPPPPPLNPKDYLAQQRQKQLEQEQEKKKQEQMAQQKQAQEYLLQQKAQLLALQQQYQRAGRTSPYAGPTVPGPGVVKPAVVRQVATSLPIAPRPEDLARAPLFNSSSHHASAAAMHAQRMAAYESKLAFPGSGQESEIQAGPPYPLMKHLAHPQLLAALIGLLGFAEWTKIPRLCTGVRRMMDEKRELREVVLERYLKTLGYARWTWRDRNEPIALSVRDVNAYMRGVSMPTHRYAEYAEQHLQTGDQGKTDSTRSLAASCRAYSKVLLRLRAQAQAERAILLLNSSSASIFDAKRPQANGRSSTMGPPGGVGGMRAPSRGSTLPPPARTPTSPNPNPNPASPPGMTFKSPIYRLGHAPLLRVFVPSPNGAWLSDESVMACEKELKRAGVLELLQAGDVVWDTAVGEEGNMGRLVWDGNYLIDLDYTYSFTGEIPRYLHSFTFPPSYFHKVIRSNGNPIVQLDISPWSREIAGNLQLLQDKVQTETPQGSRHTVVRWVHRTRFIIRPGTVLPETEGLIVDTAWEGVIVLEVEGTNEGLADLKSRCGMAEHPNMPAAKPRQEMSGRVYRLLRERSRPGEIWIRAITEKERLI